MREHLLQEKVPIFAELSWEFLFADLAHQRAVEVPFEAQFGRSQGSGH